MIKAYIYTKEKYGKILFKIIMEANIKGKVYKKEFKDIMTQNELDKPFKIIISALKKKDVEIIVETNFMYLKYDPQLTMPTTFKIYYKENVQIDFSDMENYLQENNPIIPNQFEQRRQINSNNFLVDFKNSMFILQYYLYVQKNGLENTKDLPLIEQLKQQKRIPEDYMIEDFFVLIEETLTQGGKMK